MRAGKQVFPAQLLRLLQYRHRTRGQGNSVFLARLHALGWNSPQRLDQINLAPLSPNDFAGAGGGGVAAAFVGVEQADVEWQGAPDWFASSPIAERPFCSHCGTPLGFPAPTLKIASNSDLAARKAGWIDFDAGMVIGDGFDIASDALLDLIIATASGKATRAEANEERDIAIWKSGVTL